MKKLISIMFVLILVINTTSFLCAFAENEEYIILDMMNAYKMISDLSDNITTSTSDETVAKYENGRIQAYSCGTAEVTVNSTVYKVTVKGVYPQPKTAEITKSNVKLRKWGEYDTQDVTSKVLNKGDVVTILARVDQKDAPNGVITQYVQTGDGKLGFITNKESNDRPVHNYFLEVEKNKTAETGTYDGDIYYENQKYTADNENVSVSKNSDNTATVIGEKEGLATVTSTEGEIKTSVLVTVYSPLNYNGVLNSNVAVKRSADADSRTNIIKQSGDKVTVSGECGEYYRIGDSQYVPKERVNIQPSEIAFEVDNITINKGESTEIKANITPSFAKTEIEYKSSDESIVKVDENGKVTGVDGGTATVTATTSNGKTAKCTVKVNIKLQKLILNKTIVSIMPGKKVSLKITEDPTLNTDNSLVIWKSSNTKVATVSNNGVVEGIKPGNITITATKSGINAICKVNVQDIKINKSEIFIIEGKKEKIKACFLPKNKKIDKKLKWKIKNTKIAIIDKNNNIKAKKSGSTKLTISYGRIKKTVKITVRMKPLYISSNTIDKDSIYPFYNEALAFFPSDWFYYDNSKLTIKKNKKKRFKYYLRTKEKERLIKYMLDTKYKGCKYIPKESIIKEIEEQINATWSGACEGMVVSVALNAGKKINIRKYTKSKGKGYKLNKVKYPKNSSAIKSIIHYYQLSQNNVITNEITSKNIKKESKKILKVAKLNRVQAVQIHFDKNKAGHRILALKYVKFKKGYHYISTYDPNYPKKDTYIKISKNLKKFKVSNYNSIFEMGSFSDFSCYNMFNIK